MKDYFRRKAGEDASPKAKRHGHGHHYVTVAGVVILAIVLLFVGRWWWQERRWRLIVIHHTASDRGNLEYIRRLHMEERGWSDIAYHFVVNNGSMNTTPGQVEVTQLWRERAPNFSTRVPYANQFGIAVVLVGNFERRPIPTLQREALIRLLANLARAHHIPVSRIVRHRDLQKTACPGRHVDLSSIRRDVRALLAGEMNPGKADSRKKH